MSRFYLFFTLVVLFVFTSTCEAKKGDVDPKECEVCVQVLDKIANKMEKKERKNKEKIEAAIGKYCSNKELDQREKKMCYYFDPIKRSVAHPFSLGMPMLKVCNRLKKDNPDICSVRNPEKVAPDTDYTKLRIKQLKQILNERGVQCKGCLEKSDYVKRCQETHHMDL